MSTTYNTTPTRELINGRMPVITLSAYDADGQLRPLLPGERYSDFVVSGSLSEAAIIAAVEDEFALQGNLEIGERPLRFMAVVRVDRSLDSNRHDFSDTGVLVEVEVDTKDTPQVINGMRPVTFRVDDYVGLDQVFAESYVPTMVGGLREMNLERADVAPISKLKSANTYDLTLVKDAIKRAMTEYATLNNAFQYGEPIPEAKLALYKQDIDKNPVAAAHAFIKEYANPLAGAIEHYDLMTSRSGDPKAYLEAAVGFIEVHATQMLEHDVNVAEVVTQSMKEEMDKLQRENSLRVKRLQLEAGLKKIAEELGEDTSDVEGYKRLLEEKTDAGILPDDVIRECNTLISELERSPTAVNFKVLDVLLKGIPFGNTETTPVPFDQVRAILDKKHFGLDDVKDSILGKLAIMYRKIEKGQAGYTGKPLLLIGGAGIGKTTMAESIAEATGRPLVKFELGGRSDVREMAGFARSYVGAKQGSFTNALIGSGSLASLIYLDEIDKTGKSSEGSPQSLLMSIVEDKVLKDEFLGVKIDISQAMIIATANHFDKIDPILRNRFDIMFLGAYSFAEKMEIGRRHVIPKLVEAAGLDADEINITDKALALIIKGYTREPGIRGIEKKISKICENTVKHIMLGKSESLTVTPELLVTKEWLGTPPVAPDDVPKLDTVGWANGLYGSDEGGGVLPIKTAVMRSLNMNESAITHTGELQGKMKESLVNVSTILKNMLENVIGLEAEEKFAFVHKWRTGHDFHIEAVGNSKVDGPSAGVTMTTALASQMLDLYVVKNVAMTGKLDIHGKVKAIGGLEQKIPAAREVGLVTVIVPEENRKDVEALKPDITEGVDIIFVSDIEEVLKIALPGIEDKIDLTAFRNTLERTKRVGLDGSGKDAANQNVRGGFNKKTTIGFHSPRREPVRKPSGAKKLTP